MVDEPTFDNGTNGDSQAPLTDANGSASQPVAEQVTQTPPPQEYLSRSDFEQWKSDQTALWQAQIEQVKRDAQIGKDKARDTAIRKAKAFETDYVTALRKTGVELDPAQIAAVKTEVINQNFWDETPTPETIAPNTQYAPTSIVTIDEMKAWQARMGLSDDDIDVKQFVGKDKNSYDVQVAFENAQQNAISKLAADAAETRKHKQKLKQDAAQIGQMQAAVGSVSAPILQGTPSTGVDYLAELEKMDAQDVPNDPVERTKFKARYKDFRMKAGLGNA